MNIQKGWKAMPPEITQEMVDVAQSSLDHGDWIGAEYWKRWYRALFDSAPTPTVSESETLYVVMGRLPGPISHFIDLQTADGRSVGPETGITWDEYGNFWRLGPFYAK